MYKLILADDELPILKGLLNFINWEEYGIEVAGEASNGQQALDLFEQTGSHILITDIRMPVMDGLELIKTIRKIGYNTKCIILSGYNDFEYVKEAAKYGIENYLLKPVNKDELLATMENVVDKLEKELYQKTKLQADSNILKENILYRWVTNTITHEELLYRNSMLGMDFKCNTYFIVIVHILESRDLSISESTPYKNITDPQTDYQFYANKNFNNQSVLNICSNTLRSFMNFAAFYDLDSDIVFLFTGNMIKVDKDKLREMFLECSEKIKNQHKLDTFMTIGSIEPDYQSVYKSYINAKKMIDYSLILAANTVVDYEQTEKNRNVSERDFKIDYSVIKDFITSNNKTALVNYLDEIYKTIKNTPDITPEFIRNFSAELLYSINIIVKSSRSKIHDGLKHSDFIFEKLLCIKTIDDLARLIEDFALRVVDQTNESNLDYSPIVRRAIDCIKENYTKAISLKTLAADFNVNAAYLGRIFKNETGEMFSVFLNTYRIEKAKELLHNTRLTANEISAAIGYSNVNHFFSTFKKLEGVYPAKYRKMTQ